MPTDDDIAASRGVILGVALGLMAWMGAGIIIIRLLRALVP